MRLVPSLLNQDAFPPPILNVEDSRLHRSFATIGDSGDLAVGMVNPDLILPLGLGHQPAARVVEFHFVPFHLVAAILGRQFEVLPPLVPGNDFAGVRDSPLEGSELGLHGLHALPRLLSDQVSRDSRANQLLEGQPDTRPLNRAGRILGLRISGRQDRVLLGLTGRQAGDILALPRVQSVQNTRFFHIFFRGDSRAWLWSAGWLGNRGTGSPAFGGVKQHKELVSRPLPPFRSRHDGLLNDLRTFARLPAIAD